jgi:hypothetical protein
VTGGGQILNAGANDKIAFGFTAQSTSTGVKGECSLVDPSAAVNDLAEPGRARARSWRSVVSLALCGSGGRRRQRSAWWRAHRVAATASATDRDGGLLPGLSHERRSLGPGAPRPGRPARSDRALEGGAVSYRSSVYGSRTPSFARPRLMM